MPTLNGVDKNTLAFHRALTDLAKAYQFRDRDRLTCDGITVTQCYALEAVVLRGPLTIKALSEELHLDKSSASRTADSLEAMKLIKRVAHPESRRSIFLNATAAGKALHARIETDLVEAEAQVLKEFPPGARKAATEIIRRLAAITVARMAARSCGERT